ARAVRTRGAGRRFVVTTRRSEAERAERDQSECSPTHWRNLTEVRSALDPAGCPAPRLWSDSPGHKTANPTTVDRLSCQLADQPLPGPARGRVGVSKCTIETTQRLEHAEHG